jgi:hypothetical protein
MQYLWIFTTVFMAFITGRNLLAWTIGAYFFGWVALLAVIFLPRKQEALERRVAKINEWAEKTLVKKEMGNYQNVDDLFKQLENK